MTVQVVMSGDRNVLMGMAVTGRTALESCSAPIHFNILACDLRAGDKAAIERSWRHSRCAGVSFLDIGRAELKPFRSTGYLKSKATYARYFIGRFAAERRVIYLDTDMLVSRDLVEADRLELGPNKLAAVRDISVGIGSHDADRRQRLGLRDPSTYFNAGFLIIDMDWWRAEGLEAQSVDLSVQRYHSLHSQDQDAFNILFEGRTLLLGDEWNRSQFEKNAHEGEAIVHLIGRVKPWDLDYRHSFGDAFFAVLDRTAYAGWRPERAGRLHHLRSKIERNVPSLEMIVGKVQRRLRRVGGGHA